MEGGQLSCGSQPCHSTQAHIAGAVAIIRERYADALTIDLLARECGLERSYFATMFRKLTGETVHRYLIRVRLEHARELLNAKVKVDAVALMVGFRSRATLYRSFRSSLGTTPGRYHSGQ
jgi:AraC family transcriptional regulator